MRDQSESFSGQKKISFSENRNAHRPVVSPIPISFDSFTSTSTETSLTQNAYELSCPPHSKTNSSLRPTVILTPVSSHGIHRGRDQLPFIPETSSSSSSIVLPEPLSPLVTISTIPTGPHQHLFPFPFLRSRQFPLSTSSFALSPPFLLSTEATRSPHETLVPSPLIPSLPIHCNSGNTRGTRKAQTNRALYQLMQRPPPLRRDGSSLLEAETHSTGFTISFSHQGFGHTLQIRLP